MFWKKKKPETDGISHTSTDSREAFRYAFKPGTGFDLEFKGQQVKVINISAGGLSFENTHFSRLDSAPVHLCLDVPNYIGHTDFTVDLKILTIDENNVCHCIFERCTPEDQELLHKYVLELQKNDLAH